MLVLLLIGVSAGMVLLLAFPSARTQEATQILARFQAQLDFVPRARAANQSALRHYHPPTGAGGLCACSLPTIAPPAAADDRWGNAQWLPLRSGRVTTAETSPPPPPPPG